MRSDIEDLIENGMLGDWCFFENKSEGNRLYIGLRYPAENEREFWAKVEDHEPRGDVVTLPIGIEPDGLPHWQWNGNREKPTLSPSINVIGCWHGYLRDGELETI